MSNTLVVPTAIFPALELKARETLAACEVDWSPELAVIKTVFTAKWFSSLSVEDIQVVGKALMGAGSRDYVMQSTLTKMVRAKTLRSRMISNVRHYEINI